MVCKKKVIETLEENKLTGPVLGEVLFLIAINSVLKQILPLLKAHLFADDFTIAWPGKDLNTTTKLMQVALDRLTA
ncbi:hypothetical protein KQX54_003090 [Cotesia glomerata]|uniref:Reverse transcriptase n=1 Tax=Cotesia glomerata TaxID=32391 RepID=A0AAV7IZ63_COTGL|nr:hypothetical protein KQX54_003090 [Cotesia glomerata]